MFFWSSVAWACGGFVCDPAQPVDQAGEEVIFSVDEAADRVTMHVRVAYEGPAESFAWVIPVRGTPDLLLSHEALFAHVDRATAPLYFDRIDTSECDDSDADADADSDTDTDADTDTDTYVDTGAPVVWVLDTQTVGAYEAVTLGATDATALVSWLQTNGFAIPSTLDGALAPYLADGMNFVALRLRSQGQTGTLAPLALRYEGTTPIIPLTLTAIAATPDMPLTVYLLGDARGVPLNMLHTVLNPVAIDYWSDGSNLDDVIRRAADEAGGHGFATLAAGAAGAWTGPRADDIDLSGLDAETDPGAFLRALSRRGVPMDQRLIDALIDVLPAPTDYPGGASAYYAALANDDVTHAAPFDPVAAVAAIDAVVLAPLADAEALVASSRRLTRLRSSLSPDEMTVDPIFAFNPDLSGVLPSQSVQVEVLCAEASVSEAQQLLKYPGGPTLLAPSASELRASGQTLFTWAQGSVEYATLRIEQLDTRGPPEVVVDHGYVETDGTTNPTQIPTEVPLGSTPSASEGAVTGGGGCGCSGGGGASSLAFAALMVLIGRRRAA